MVRGGGRPGSAKSCSKFSESDAGAVAARRSLLLPAGAAAATPDERELTEVVVTGGATTRRSGSSTDPRKPRQPLPAHDGADYLKTIPGFSVIRKGGTDGDPVLRGMAGSRLGILLDGEHILGGCGRRMDPPTAYVFPESFDRITVIKGPQSVLNGPGNSAGVVLFEREPRRYAEPGASRTRAGSADRSAATTRSWTRAPARRVFQAQGVARARTRTTTPTATGGACTRATRAGAPTRPSRGRRTRARGWSSPARAATARPPTPTA